MIYRAEDIYKIIKDGPEITSESEFMNLYRSESGDPTITDEMLLPAFSDLRLALGVRISSWIISAFSAEHIRQL